MTATETAYGADQIKALEGLEAVRHRPGMYIGTTDSAGMHHLAWEVIDNSVDEAMGGYASKIEVILNPDGSMTVADDGRGIPVEPQKSGSYIGMPTIEMVMTVLHAGGKFDEGAYQFSGGLHGVGISVVNALSSRTEAEVRRDGKVHRITFGYLERDGKMVSGAVDESLHVIGKTKKDDTGTRITFYPDEEVFGTQEWSRDTIVTRLKNASFLNAGLRFLFTDNRNDDGETQEFHYPNGLDDFIDEVTAQRLADANRTKEDLSTPDHIRFNGADETVNGSWDMVLRWFPDSSYRVLSFANGIYTRHGGAHVKGYEQVLTALMNRYAKQDHIGLLSENGPKLEAADVRSGLGVIISVKVKNPQFKGQTKDELSNDDTRKMVREGFSEQFTNWMEEHPTEAKAIIESAIEEMRLRHRMAAAEEAERNKAEKQGRTAEVKKSPKLADSLKHGENAELFIVEGDSASAGPIKQRDREWQAVLPIRGKSLNIEKALTSRNGADVIENNQLVQGIIGSIGAGSRDHFDIDKIRYGKIIILADADDDGKHIQILLMTTFYRLMPEFVRQGRLYIARPPLFSAKLKGKKEKHYFYSEEEMNQFLAEHPNADVTRNKGLGEMNEPDLGRTTIHYDTRTLDRVVIEDDSIADQTIASLMGKNSDSKWEALKEVVIDTSEV